MNKKKVAYVSGTRADFGLMSPVLRAITNSKLLSLSIYTTGMHLMKKFGYSHKLVTKEFKNVKKINATFKKDNELGMAGFISSFLQQIIISFSNDRPDFVLTLGDRPEMLAVAVACNYLHIPTGQLHGGEKTSTVDEISRHAITKLSHLHFPATKESAERILKMGEESWRVHVVGAPSLDVILNQPLPNKHELETKLGLKIFKKKPILITLHPISNNWEQASSQIQQTLNAVKKIERDIIIVYPNADSGGSSMIRKIQKYKKIKKFHIFPNIEYPYFLALEREAAVWVGNSSGAIIESSSFKLPVVNIGPRQEGRQRANNIIDVDYNTAQISAAVKKALTNKKFLEQVQQTKNPWGDGKTAPRITHILEKLTINKKLLNKKLTYA